MFLSVLSSMPESIKLSVALVAVNCGVGGIDPFLGEKFAAKSEGAGEQLPLDMPSTDELSCGISRRGGEQHGARRSAGWRKRVPLSIRAQITCTKSALSSENGGC